MSPVSNYQGLKRIAGRFGMACMAFAIMTAAATLHASPKDPACDVPSEQRGMQDRLAEKTALAKTTQFDLILVGDSITANLDKPEYKPVWDKYYGGRHALDLGFGGARTQNVLWTVQSGILDNQKPKVVMLLIGTNNADDRNYRTHYTPEEIAGGIEADVNALRAKLPDAKILLLRILPYGDEPNLRRATNDRASELAEAAVVDWQHVIYCDVNQNFLNLDGSIIKTLMPDALHPNPDGAELQARAIEPVLSELLGEAASGAAVTGNTAIIPHSKLENDSYDWWQRHQDELDAHKTIHPEIVLIGDSITHFWGGPPTSNGHQNGPNAWKEAFGDKQVLNLGFGWDRTQNVLWRLDHGEFDGLHPKTVVINIGTNNFTGTGHARTNTPEEIAEGIMAIVGRVRSKSPESRIIVMGVFPRFEKPTHPGRAKITALNALVAADLANVPNTTFLDIGAQMLQPDGTISRSIMGDFTHPTEAGYSIWAKGLLAAMK